MGRNAQGKYFDIGIKGGWSIEDFMSDLHLETKEALFSFIDDSFNAKCASTLKNKIEQNGKRKRKSSKTSKNENAEAVITCDNLNVAIIKNPPSTTEASVETIESLTEAASKLQEQIASIEASREKYRSKRIDLYNSLGVVKKELKELLSEVEKKETMTNNLLDKLAKADEIIKANSEEISSKESELAKISEKIAKLSKVEFSFLNDGSFTSSREVTEPSADDIKKYLDALMMLEISDNLTLKQLKGIAKLKATINTLESEYSVSFESEDISEAYSSI